MSCEVILDIVKCLASPFYPQRSFYFHYQVRSWFEEVIPGLNDHIVSCIIGMDSLKATSLFTGSSAYEAVTDIRLRMDGLFELKEHALQFVREFTALYTNGPAGGGGIW